MEHFDDAFLLRFYVSFAGYTLHPLSLGRGGGLRPLALEDECRVDAEQGDTLDDGLDHGAVGVVLVGDDAAHDADDLVQGHIAERVNALADGGAGHALSLRLEERDDLVLERHVLLVLGGGLALGGVLAGQQLDLMGDERIGILDGRAILRGLAVEQGRDIREAHGLGDFLFHSDTSFLVFRSVLDLL